VIRPIRTNLRKRARHLLYAGLALYVLACAAAGRTLDFDVESVPTTLSSCLRCGWETGHGLSCPYHSGMVVHGDVFAWYLDQRQTTSERGETA